ncbi:MULTISPECIES: CCA tRNA nucleotidyltransferase [Prochlorococcus]|uniref:CCA tRNA nucleotidyltransferase n=1 Tax=Prochlorococcus TaxID=1218 RepID=UPI000533BB7D|nr:MULTISPECIES: CCA tRNA nucleotidyltransferase [Prochlorococcus]KGG13061.1 tRNA nucleotidyltransferase [Prochlorococcus sp. MIT 0601]
MDKPIIEIISPDFLNKLPGLPKNFLSIIKISAKEASIKRIGIVGGVIRDRIIYCTHKSTLGKYKDIDFVIEGSAEEFAEVLQTNLKSEKVSIAQRNSIYQTIQLIINEVRFDLATARKETYLFPGENPKVAPCNIKEDLRRRDFSMNALCLELLSNHLIDQYQGLNAIRDKKIEFIHAKSVEEDPTRIFRAARYAGRLGFELESKSLEQVISTLNIWPWNWSDKDCPKSAPPALSSRLRMELDILLEDEPWENCIRKLQDWQALVLLDEDLQNDCYWQKRIKCAFKLHLNPLIAFISAAKKPTLLAQRLGLSKHHMDCLAQAMEIKQEVSIIQKENNFSSWKPSKWCSLIENSNWQRDSVVIAICLGVPLWKPLFKWLKKWRLVKSKLTAKELLSKGWEPGPKIGQELKRLRDLELDNR